MDTTKNVICFDFHDVIVVFDWYAFLSVLWRTQHKCQILYCLFLLILRRDIFNFGYNGITFEAYLDQLTINYGIKAQYLKILLRDVINCQKADWSLLHLIKKLKQAGHLVYLLSNIEEGCLEDLRGKQPELFENFDDFFVRSAENNFAEKSQVEYFHIFKQKIQRQDHVNYRFILIDDQLQNCLTARKEEFLTIHCPKNKLQGNFVCQFIEERLCMLEHELNIDEKIKTLNTLIQPYYQCFSGDNIEIQKQYQKLPLDIVLCHNDRWILIFQTNKGQEGFQFCLECDHEYITFGDILYTSRAFSHFGKYMPKQFEFSHWSKHNIPVIVCIF